ncbi:glucosaminidase domain-containing protein [Rhizobium ruizarguesonis]
MSSDTARQANLGVLHPIVRAAVNQVIQQLQAEGLPFEVFEAYRTPERQHMLYAQGRTAAGDIVTKARAWASYHQYGMAVDFVLRLDGEWSWSSKGKYAKMWERLHAIGRANDLEPLSWELPHLQYSGTTIERLQSGDYPALGDEAWAENLTASITGWTGSERAPPLPPNSAARPAIKIPEDQAEQTFETNQAPDDDGVSPQPEIGLTSEIVTAAKASQRLWGVPTSVTLAQFILESAGGKRMPSGSNNPFGIKAKGDEPFVLARTHEVEGGQTVVVMAKFRKFASFDEAFSQHGRLLGTSSYYRKAMAVRDDPFAFANALTGVYATDPNYGGKLIRLINQYELAAYDDAAADGQERWSAQIGANGRGGGMALRFGDRGENVKALQQMLKTAGYSVGAIDGIYGSLTRAAVGAFQADNSLKMTGQADDGTTSLLNRSPSRPLARERLNATEADLLQDGSKTVLEARRTKLLGWITGIFGALGIGNSAVTNASGDTAAPVPGLENFVTQVQTYLANPTAPGASALLQELRTNTPLVAEALKSVKAGDVGDLLAKLQPLIADHVSSGAIKPINTVFDLLANSLQGAPGLQSTAQVIASIAGSVVPGFGGSAVALGVGLLAHYFGAKISQARVQEHREGSNLSR